MAGQLPVTGVGVGDQSGFGLASVANAAATVAPAGFDAGVFPKRLFVYEGGQNGVTVDFAFTQSYTAPSPLNTPFVFDGSYLVTGVSAGDTSLFGRASVVNSAQQLLPTGWDSTAYGRSLVWLYDVNAGVGVDFLFVDAYTPPTALNTPFYFGGQVAAAGVTLGAQGAVGGATVETVAQLFPVGIAPRTTVGKPRVGDRGDLNFAFVDSYTPPSALNVPFYFGSTIVASPSAGDTSRFGFPTVRNYAWAITPSGIDSQRFGRALTYFKSDNGAGVDFHFTQSYVQPSSLNVPFYFAGLLSVNAGSISDGEFGYADVQNRIRYVTVPGTDAGAYGTPSIGRYVIAAGFGGEASGTPLVMDTAVFYQHVNPYDFTSTDYGTATVYNLSNDGFGQIPPGDVGAAKVSYRFALEGVDSAAYGKPGISPQFVRPTGWTGAIGAVTFDQTLTTRTVKPTGFSSYVLGTLKVDPRSIYPPGFVATTDQARFGDLRVSRNEIVPLGIAPSDFGTPKVGETKQYVVLASLDPPVEQVSQPQVIGRWEYVRPSSVVESGLVGDVSVRNAVRYLSPEGFDGSYFPPYQPEVYNRNQLVLPYSWVSPGALTSVPNVYNAAWQIIPVGQIGPETFGPETDVGELVRTVYPEPFDAAQYGTAVIKNAARLVDLSGRGIAGVAGTPLVAPAKRYIDLDGYGVDAFEAGTNHLTDYGSRFVRQVGNILGSAYGTATVESSIRTVDLSTFGIAPPALTGTTVWFGVRSISPASVWPYTFDWEQTGRFGRVEYALKYTTPFGWDSLTFGTTDVARNEVVVRPPSIVGAVGLPNVEWSRRYLTPRTVENFTEWGTAWVSASPRYVQQIFDDNSQKLIGGVGVPWGVENGNKTITNYGWQSSRFSSGNYVYNNARVLEQKGRDQAEYGDAFVSFAIRTIYPEGWDSASFTVWGTVYNYSRIIEPSGIPRAYAGVPYVWSNTQWVDLFGSDNVHIRWGDALVASSLRTISLDLQLGAVQSGGIAPPLVSDAHYVGLFRQAVAPKAIAPLGVGDQTFEIRFNIIKAWGSASDTYGEPSVRNGTPEVTPLPWGEFDMSTRHAVGLYTRTVEQAGFSIPPPHEFLPRPVVDYRTKLVAPRGFDALRIPNLHDVRFDAPQIPAAQLIDATPGYVTHEPPFKIGFGTAKVQSSPFPQGWDSSVFGAVEVRLQGCYPYWDQPSSEFGIPRIPRPIVITGVCVRRDGDTQNRIPQTDWGRPRITPHTVWATPDTPQQAVDNHPESDTFTLIDDLGDTRGPDVQWGRATVTSRIRYIYHFHRRLDEGDTTIGEQFGEPETNNKNRQLKLDGIAPGLCGIPDIPWRRFVYVVSWRSDVFGTAEIVGKLPEYNAPVTPTGTAMTAFGTTKVELRNRVIYPTGTRMDVFGNNNPMVHYPRKVTDAGGYDLSVWGTGTVEFFIRQIFPEGTDMFASTYDPMGFAYRMRVRKATNPTTATGFDASSAGKPSVQLAVRKIGPYQIPPAKCFGHDVAVHHEEEFA